MCIPVCAHTWVVESTGILLIVEMAFSDLLVRQLKCYTTPLAKYWMLIKLNVKSGWKSFKSILNGFLNHSEIRCTWSFNKYAMSLQVNIKYFFFAGRTLEMAFHRLVDYARVWISKSITWISSRSFLNYIKHTRYLVWLNYNLFFESFLIH